MENRWSEEAINERDPEYQLPETDHDTVRAVTLTPDDLACWRWMVYVRPLLACLEDEL